MKRFLIVSVILLLMLALTVSAQEAKKMKVYVGAGLGIPTGDAGDGWNLGFHGQAGLGFKVSPQLEVIPTIAYHTFGLDKQGTPVSGGTLSVLMFGGDLKVSLGKERQKTNPFVFGGAGMGNAKIGDLTIPGFGTLQGDSETKVYFNFGAGLDIESSPNMAIFFKGSFVSVATSGSSITYIPFTVGLRF